GPARRPRPRLVQARRRRSRGPRIPRHTPLDGRRASRQRAGRTAQGLPRRDAAGLIGAGGGERTCGGGEVLVDYTRDSETCRKDHYHAVTSEYETNQLTSNPFEGQSAQ